MAALPMTQDVHDAFVPHFREDIVNGPHTVQNNFQAVCLKLPVQLWQHEQQLGHEPAE